jgi:hypothetical protein
MAVHPLSTFTPAPSGRWWYHAQKNYIQNSVVFGAGHSLFSLHAFNKHLTSKLQFSPNFTLNSVADCNYRGNCDVGGFLIFEWTLDS